jgi:hypothetical protein
VTAAGGRFKDAGHRVLSVRVRSATGRVLARRVVSASAGRWQARLAYRVAHAQTGTLEAVELSAKDGALSCLVQAPVALTLGAR